MKVWDVGLLSVLVGLSVGRAELPLQKSAPPKLKTVRLLSIGNSFTKDALRFLPQILEADGRFALDSVIAYKGGCSLQTHWEMASANGGKMKPYAGKSLRELLESKPWDIVTIQQASILSHRLESYQPYAGELVKYIHTHAPTAEVWMHETWAYRADDTATYTNGLDQQGMHEGLRKAYHDVARQVGITNIIPVGDAFQAATQHADWSFTFPDPTFDYARPTYPNVPSQKHSLHLGSYWKTNADGVSVLLRDTHHANKAGQYLGSAVWFERLFGASIVGNTFVPGGGGITTNDVQFLQRIAHATVLEASNNTP